MEYTLYTQYSVNLVCPVQCILYSASMPSTVEYTYGEWGTVTHKGLSCLLRSLIKQSHHWTIIMTLIINDIIMTLIIMITTSSQ